MNIQSLLTRAKSFIRPSAVTSVLTHDGITDEWFRSHYGYAAGLVSEWLSKEIQLSSSRILDFGCGDGIMDLGLARRFQPREVIGADIHDAYKYLLDTARTQLGMEALPRNLRFLSVRPGEALASIVSVDAVYSWSVFEHIEKSLIATILQDIYTLLPKQGVFFLQIEPLYFSPHGSHLSGLLTEPWVHLLASHEELMEMVDKKQPVEMAEDQKNKTFDVCSFSDFKDYLKREYQSLNRLTVDELMKFVESAGFVVEHKKLNMTDLEPSARLLENFSSVDLKCNEIMLLLRKP